MKSTAQQSARIAADFLQHVLVRCRSTFMMALVVFSGVVSAGAGEEIDFSRDVAPILSDKCFLCHGPDAGTREADLRLDLQDEATAWAIVPHKPDESVVMERILSEDSSLQMPPASTGLKLTSEEKEIIRKWIENGAVYEIHWAFKDLPEAVEIPEVKTPDWVQQPIDAFILSRLEAEKISPSPEASPLRWLRRATLDLTGLPPTPEEIEQFLADSSEDQKQAKEKAVERLLDSPAYGEQIALDWMDAARYADSHGFQSDNLNTQWPYRDWVINAFNRNLPYDEFLTWQLAGDLLENPTEEQILATAFNRMHRMTNEGGSIAEEWLVENTADRVHTLGTAILGLTLECSRCHDHKYDPISARDYYSIFAFFNSIDENGMYDHPQKVPSPALMLPTADQKQNLQAAWEKAKQSEQQLTHIVKEGEGRFQEWLTALPEAGLVPDRIVDFRFGEEETQPINHVADSSGTIKNSLTKVDSPHGKGIQLNGDDEVVISGLPTLDRWNEFTFDFQMRDPATERANSVVFHQSFGTDVGYNGIDLMIENGYLTARVFRIWPGNALGIRTLKPLDDQWHRVTFTYDGSSRAEGIKLFIDGQLAETEILRDHLVKSASARYFGGEKLALGARFRDRGFSNGEIDEFRLFHRALSPLEIAQIDVLASEPISLNRDAQTEDQLREYFFSAIDLPTREARRQLLNDRQAAVKIEDGIHEVAVMQDMETPRQAYLLDRGAYDAPKTEEARVERDVFETILPAFPEEAPRDRAGLAEWLTHPDHPLTARVYVNRTWARFFGAGLVSTPENFGLQGASPTHPELLDWLSRDFVNHGWDIKHLCKRIVLSATYGQDSQTREDLQTIDPENKLLARGPARRLSAEQIRDLALASSGLIDLSRGGPPVSPYQPGKDLWRESNAMSPAYQQSTGQGLYRRSIYSVWKRTAPLPNQIAFDATSREVCIVSRSSTNTPLQALVLLNDVQFVEAARHLAEEVIQQNADQKLQIASAFQRVTGRLPDEIEQQLLEQLLIEQLQIYSDDGIEAARQLIAIGDSKAEESIEAGQLAAMTVLCQVIMNLDAAIWNR